MSNIVPHKPQLRTGGAIAPIVPQSIEEAFRLAHAIVSSGMAPKSINTPEKAMVAMLAGLEVGLTPMAALQSIAVVNGAPTIWGDGALGLVRGSGLCGGVREWIEGDGDNAVAYCEVKRKGEDDPILRSFSVAQAKKAGLLNKQGPWQDYRSRMLQMRARSYALRDGFADVLRGLRIREEVEDYTPIAETPPGPGIGKRLADARSGAAPQEGFNAAHGAPVEAEAEIVDVETGEIVEAAVEPASEAHEAEDAIAEEEAPDLMTRLKVALDDAVSLAAVDLVQEDFRSELNALKGGDRAKARDLLADARDRVSSAG